jgi:hypothetical protein
VVATNYYSLQNNFYALQKYVLYAANSICFKQKLENEGFKPVFIQKNLWKFHYAFSLAIRNLERSSWESKFKQLNVGALDKLFGGQGRIKGIQKRYSKWVLDTLCWWGVLIRQHTNVPATDATGKKIALTRVDIKVDDNALVDGYQEWVAPAGFRTCELVEEPLSFEHLEGIYRAIAENNQAVLEFDVQAARAYAYQAYVNKEALPDKRIDNKLLTNRYVTKTIYQFYLTAISKMEQKLYRPQADNAVGKTNRFFSLISNLPRPLRQFIAIGGQKLVEVDVRSCQPLVFAIYLKRYYAALNEPLPTDVAQYIALVEAGQFYFHAQDLVLAPGEDMNYDLFKVTFFARVFYSNEQRQYQWRTRFAAAFPNVSRIISEFKSESYKDLPQKLTHLESEIMLHRVSTRLFNEGITDQFSLHDAFYCTLAVQERIKQLITEEFQKDGVIPCLVKTVKDEQKISVILSAAAEPTVVLEASSQNEPVMPFIEVLDSY